MGDLTHAELRDRAEEIFDDSSNIIITEPIWASALQDGVVEMSQYDPQPVKHILNVTNGSRDLDLSSISGLNRIREIEYPVGNWPRSKRTVPESWGDTVELQIDIAPSASVLGDLTGTVTFSDGSTAITGSGTAFTTELEEGWYIKKSGSSAWHRIATITDDTNLVLATQVAAADDGADTAGATDYWFQYAYLYCAKVHYLSILTDLLGAIDLTAGYEAGAMLIHIDELQASGTLKKNTIFTIAGVSGSYRVTEDATIASNECDVKISPSLAGDVGDDAVVTIKPSSLTSELERILPELAAGMAARNWYGDARTQIDSAVSLHATITTSFGKLGDEAVLAIADLATAREEINKVDISGVVTAVNQIQKQVDRAEAEIKKGGAFIGKKNDAAVDLLNKVEARVDKAITDVGMFKSKIVDRTTEAIAAVDAMAAETTLGIADLASGRSLINKITIGGNPVGRYISSAGAEYGAASTKAGEVSANLRIRGMGTEHLAGAGVELQAGLAKVSLANSYLNVDRPSTLHNNNAARELQAASTLFGKANILLNLDAKSASLVRNAQVEVQAGNAYLGQGNAYLNQLAGRLRIVSSLNQTQVWADKKIAQAKEDLRRLSKPRQKQYFYPTS